MKRSTVKIALRMLRALTFGLLIAATTGAQAMDPEPQHEARRNTPAVSQERVSGADTWMMIGVGAGLVILKLRRNQKSLQHPLTLT